MCSKQKIFEIGVMKTGTTSLSSALEILGYNHITIKEKININYANPFIYFNRVTYPQCENYFLKFPPPDIEPLKSEAYTALYSIIEKYDSFDDVPFNHCDFRLLDAKFPNSKFILLERDDESWINSVKNWITKNPGVPKVHRINEWNKDIEDQYLQWKKKKYSSAIEYFTGDKKDQLLIMNIKDGWEPLCRFLNKEIPDKVAFPYLNKTSDYLK